MIMRSGGRVTRMSTGPSLREVRYATIGDVPERGVGPFYSQDRANWISSRSVTERGGAVDERLRRFG